MWRYFPLICFLFYYRKGCYLCNLRGGNVIPLMNKVFCDKRFLLVRTNYVLPSATLIERIISQYLESI